MTHILVVGNGMVGQRFVEHLVAGDVQQAKTVTVIGEETRPAYDRVGLSSWFEGRSEADLSLVDEGFLDNDRLDQRYSRLQIHPG